MNAFTRWWEVTRREFLAAFRRPAQWVLLVILALMAIGLAQGSVVMSTGSFVPGAERPHITSVYNQSMIQGIVMLAIAAWFLAISCGMVVIRDLELQVTEVFHSTRLTPREYAWGKFCGAVGAFAAAWLLFLVFLSFFAHIVRGSGGSEYIGPFSPWNYLFPTLLFGVPQILLFGGVAFFLGTWTRRPIIVFAFPMASVLVTLTFFTTWSPDWLSPDVNRLLMLIDPSGFRWLDETFLAVDRGVEFYNTQALRPDAGFVISRVVVALLGLAAVAGAVRSYARRMLAGGVEFRFLRRLRRRKAPVAASAADPVLTPSQAAATTLTDLEMTTRPIGFRKGAGVIARGEIRDLLVRPGMYLFVPLILFTAIDSTLFTTGPFSSRLLYTPGAMAEAQLNTLNLLLCFLLLFYTVESLHKERSRRIHEIFGATPVGTGAVLLGKTLGNSVMAGFILLMTLAANAVILLYHQFIGGSPVGFDVFPFVAVWGAVLIPTFIFWTALITALFSLLRNRYAVYGLGVGLILYTIFDVQTGDGMTWVTNWLGWGVLGWSDMGTFTLHGTPLLLNRLLYLSLVPLLVGLSVKWYGRQDFDAVGIIHRLRPKPLLVSALRLLPLGIPAIVLASILAVGGERGYQGDAAGEWAEDYWERNTATWTDFRMPSVSRVDLDLDFEPSERSVAVKGEYTFFNHRDYAYERLPITAGPWDPIEWTFNGEPYEPEDRSNLFIFTPDAPLGPADTLTIGFEYDFVFMEGMSQGPGGAGQFILESGIVLTAFGPNFVPVPGYLPGIGVDEDNSAEPRDQPDDFYEGETEPAFGWGGAPFAVRTRITTPEAFTANGVGQLVSSEVADGRRTVVWETDHPVTLFNVIAGKYEVIEGDGTAIYHHPEHDYNIEEMSAALDAARRYYSEWFYPFPWDLLKISEFPDYAGYAQGFPTNITFSEGIGFLAKSDPVSHVAFMVVAHESAHQWWGNLLVPGDGPGGNILSEGMSHYATMLLHEQVYGDRYRIEFGKRTESAYGRGRFVDAERPLVKTDGSRAGDGTVTYEKGAWVMWMLQQEMGRDNILAGLRDFIGKYNPDPDFPVLQDMLAVLRGFAPDTARFDAFADQWFHDVVVPEYEFEEVTKTLESAGAGAGGGEDVWVVRGTIRNVGSGELTVEVAATAGDRWSDEADDAGGSVVAGGYRDARTEVTLGTDQSAEFEIRAGFDPERVLVDPDVGVLQLNRDAAVFDF
ncbi:ABC transporter permease/M1 family aminopeptidase [Candidatus Palauibacter sp.]|uniref:ABC transporter permease/M1 family aminopeptidase n=1 Tax=Candidatus Palauibacter sp. TaxID=3101350 RepID=UPI003AF23FBE